jgi:hypothetical protein
VPPGEADYEPSVVDAQARPVEVGSPNPETNDDEDDEEHERGHVLNLLIGMRPLGPARNRRCPIRRDEPTAGVLGFGPDLGAKLARIGRQR